MSLKIFVECDTNDADYISNLCDFTDERYDLIMRVVNNGPRKGCGIQWTMRHLCDDYKYKEEHPYLDESEIDFLTEIILPSHEEGFHTINSVKLIRIEETLI